MLNSYYLPAWLLLLGRVVESRMSPRGLSCRGSRPAVPGLALLVLGLIRLCAQIHSSLRGFIFFSLFVPFPMFPPVVRDLDLVTPS